MQEPLPTLWPQSLKDEAEMKRELEFYKEENRSLKALVEGMELSRCGLTLAKVERGYILDTLVCCHGNRTYTARILGISLRTLRSKLHYYAQSGCAVCEPNSQLDQFICERAKSPFAPCRRH